MSQRPCATVVIPCLNEVAHIGPCLDSMRRQKGLEDPVEVIVVDGGSTDGTRDVLYSRSAEDAWLRILDNPDRITPIAMNMGIAAAASDVVIIVGAHAEVAEDFIRRNLEALRAHPESGCVGGVVEQVHGDEMRRRIGLALTSPFGVGDARFRTGGVAGHVDTVAFGAYRKSVLDELGGLDESLVRNQDDELNYRLTESGWRIWFDPRIRSTYHARSTYGQLFRQYRQYGYWKVFVNAKHFTVTTWRQLAPASLLLSTVLLLVAGIVGAAYPTETGGFSLAFPALGTVWGLWGVGALFAMSLGGVALRDAWGVFRTFAVLHLAYGWGYCQGIWRFLLLRRAPAAEFKTLTR